MILLEQNYRSTQIILDAAKAIIRHNRERVDKELFTDRQGGARIIVRETYNDVEEADQVLTTIEQLMLEGVNSGGCAIMYRTNAQSRVLEEAFLRVGMSYRLVGATRFYGRREIKDLIAYLRLIHNQADSVSFTRVVNTPPRGIGKKTQQDLFAWAERHGWQPGEALLKLVEEPEQEHSFGGRALKALSRFGQLLQSWISLKDQVTVGDLLDTILEGSGYRLYIDDGTTEGDDRWANVMELRSVAVEFEDHNLSQFLEQVALVSDVDDLEEDPNAPTLLTLHAAKGLEFPVVFIVGLEEGMLPHSRSLDDGEELAEERRLFYVGLTRAKDRVYLSHAFRRTFYGNTEVTVPSRFLGEIPEKLIEGGTSGERRRESKRRASDWSWSPPSKKMTTGRRGIDRVAGQRNQDRKPLPKPHAWIEEVERKPKAVVTEATYRTGQRVHHKKFGDGIVIESKLTGNDEEVVVAFSETGVGIKKLVASLAKLEIKE
jgi:DNA helicase-2/ATP-dependent DNA helicase PcrA